MPQDKRLGKASALRAGKVEPVGTQVGWREWQWLSQSRFKQDKRSAEADESMDTLSIECCFIHFALQGYRLHLKGTNV